MAKAIVSKMIGQGAVPTDPQPHAARTISPQMCTGHIADNVDPRKLQYSESNAHDSKVQRSSKL